MLRDLDDHLRGLLCSGLLMLIFSGTVVAQKGTAPNGYYPAGYNGATFTGKVVLTTDDTMTLNYVHGSKTDTFEAYATAPLQFAINQDDDSTNAVIASANGRSHHSFL
jgi:hypothetical protein